jgi:hypothetical protein
MTDKEIMKALKVCAKNETPFCCGECELGENNSSCDCVDRLLKLSLDLINRQQAEIERLKNSGIRANSVEDWLDYCNGLKAEAIKEYMKILEEKLSQNTDISNVGYQSIIFDMEQGYKEMVGEG